MEAVADSLADDPFGEVGVWLLYSWSWIGLDILLWEIIQVKFALCYMMLTDYKTNADANRYKAAWKPLVRAFWLCLFFEMSIIEFDDPL